MIESLSGIFTAFGLSSSAGLNAYLPLLIVALTARFTNLITLQAPFDWLTNPWVITLLAVLLVIEIFADKVPLVDHANDVIQTVVRPAAGAILFAANANVVTNVHPALALGAGLLLAGGVHTAKATVRPIVTATTGGLGNPVVSTVEDIVALVVSVMSILLPILTFIAIVVLAAIIWRKWLRRKAQHALETPVL
ncbi:MAG TPA: DUF4126 domain-containing protein [Anaerolineae bacterium]|nr:DUF4126 domain-containing protein [Anaerolineae bacterium]